MERVYTACRRPQLFTLDEYHAQRSQASKHFLMEERAIYYSEDRWYECLKAGLA